jgi:carbamoylphosphate synthase large subunit
MIIHHIGIVGECNVQYATGSDPRIPGHEENARLSRSPPSIQATDIR